MVLWVVKSNQSDQSDVSDLSDWSDSPLPVLVHVAVVAFVVAGGNVVHPFLVVEIPADGLFDAFLELQARFPAELALELAGVDGVAHVVAEAVGDVGYQLVAVAFGVAEEAVNRLDHHADYVDVLPFVEAADVVGLSDLAVVEDGVDGAGVVFHEEPVAHVLTLAIDGQRLAVAYVVDEERYQFFGELVGTVVVGAVGHERRHAVGVVVCAHEVVARSLRGRIRGMGVVFGGLKEEFLAVGVVVFGRGRRGEGGFYPFGVGEFERAIHLVGRDMVEELPFVFLRQRLPVFLCGLQEGQGAHHVGAGESEGVFDGAVNVALGGQMDDAGYLMFADDASHLLEVGNVGLDESVVGTVLDVLEVCEVAGIRQLVEVDDMVVGILVDKKSDNMGTDESGSAGDQYILLIIHNAQCIMHNHFLNVDLTMAVNNLINSLQSLIIESNRKI